jgi:hypothetical protein
MNVCAHGLIPYRCSRGEPPEAAGAGPPDPEQVATCRRWLALFARPRKTINPRRHSYGLKHDVERWAGGYVGNGAFIAAALAEGYRVRQVDRGPNAFFNMSFAER